MVEIIWPQSSSCSCAREERLPVFGQIVRAVNVRIRIGFCADGAASRGAEREGPDRCDGDVCPRAPEAGFAALLAVNRTSLAPRAGVPQPSKINAIGCQTSTNAQFERQGLFAALSNREPDRSRRCPRSIAGRAACADKSPGVSPTDLARTLRWHLTSSLRFKFSRFGVLHRRPFSVCRNSE